MACEARNKLIHVTGFGEFSGFEKVNPSWEAVSLLPDSLDVNGTSYAIQKHRVPVAYNEVDAKVPTLWKDNPAVSFNIFLFDFG